MRARSLTVPVRRRRVRRQPSPIPGVCAMTSGAEKRSPAVGIVLAAGAARRFGRPKVLADLAGRPMITHVVDAAFSAGLAPLVVVAGRDPEPLRRALDASVRIVANPLAALGQSTSVRVGFEAAAMFDAATAVVLMGDEPGVSPRIIRRVVEVAADGVPARARYTDGPGHPVAVPRAFWEEIAAGVWGDEGARTVLAHLAVRNVVVATSRPIDVDRPADLDAAAEALASRERDERGRGTNGALG